jgi:hypothetical protein
VAYDDDDDDDPNVSRRYLVAGRTPGRLIEELAETTRAPDEIMVFARSGSVGETLDFKCADN